MGCPRPARFSGVRHKPAAKHLLPRPDGPVPLLTALSLGSGNAATGPKLEPL